VCLMGFLLIGAVLFTHPKMTYMFLLIMGTLIAACFILWGQHIKFPTLLVYIGNISYSIYLTHTFIIKACIRLIYPVKDISLISMLLLAIYFLVVVLCSSIWYALFEIDLTNKVSNAVLKK